MEISLTIPSTVTEIDFEFTLSNEKFPNLVELTCYKHHVSNNYHIIDKLTNITKIEVINGSLDDVVVNYQYHMRMKKKGIILNNIDYDDSDYKHFKGILYEGVKSISFYSPEKYNMKELIERKIEIRSINCKIKRIEIPFYQTKLYPDFFAMEQYYSETITKILIRNYFNRRRNLY